MSTEAPGTEAAEYEMVGGMIAAETPQRVADRVLELIRAGDIDGARAIIEERAARAAAAIGKELAAAERGPLQ